MPLGKPAGFPNFHWKVLMNSYYPPYYHSFRCIAVACPDSCCKEWAVDVDPQAAVYYRSLPGALGERLRAVLQDTEDGTVMTIENGRCPMWRQDGLCRIQAELGHDALCKTCREFPRLKHDFGDFEELGLELSCPEAARLILRTTDFQLLKQWQPGGEVPEYDPEAMDILRASRETVLSFLADTPYSLPETLAIILLYSHSVQAQLDGAEPQPFDPDVCLAAAKSHTGAGDMGLLFQFFSGLEILTPQWKSRLEHSPAVVCWSQPLRALMGYMVQRYWLQAVSDYDLVCRVKFGIITCLLVGALGGDPVQTAQQFSKEIENDPCNVEAILDGAYTQKAFTDVNLISLLLA